MADRSKPSPAELWQQAGGGTAEYSRERYRELLIEHGHLIPGRPEPLPCGWPVGTQEADRSAYPVRRCGQQSAHGPHVMDHGPDQPRNCPGTGHG